MTQPQPMTFENPRDADVSMIQWSVQATNKKPDDPACLYVPGIDARAHSALLDRWVGPFNWQDEYTIVTLPAGGDRSIYGVQCTLLIRDRDADGWVRKIGWAPIDGSNEDLTIMGSESHAFKRASTKAGIGRNVSMMSGVWGPGFVNKAGKIGGVYKTQSGEPIEDWLNRKAGLAPARSDDA